MLLLKDTAMPQKRPLTQSLPSCEKKVDLWAASSNKSYKWELTKVSHESVFLLEKKCVAISMETIRSGSDK